MIKFENNDFNIRNININDIKKNSFVLSKKHSKAYEDHSYKRNSK